MRIPFPKLNRYTVLLVLGLSANALLWWVLSRFPTGTAPLVLHFRIGGAIDVLGNRQMLMTIPLIGLLVLLVNGMLTVLLHRRDAFLAGLVAVVAVFVQFLLAAAMGLLWWIN